MPIPVQCTCGLVMEAPDEMIGQTCECPQCKSQFIVPAPAPAAAPSPTAAAQQPQRQPRQSAAARQRKQSQTLAADPGGLGSLLDEVGIQKARSRHTCPECRADIASDAVICVSCGMNLETGKRVKQKLYPSEPKPKKATPHPGQKKESASSGRKESLGLPMMIVSFLLPFVGWIYYFVNKTSEPHKANQAGSLGCISFLLNISLFVVRRWLSS